MKKEKKIKEKKPKRRNQPVPPEITEARERRAYHLRIVEGRKLDEITKILNEEYPAYPLKSDHEGVRKMIIRVQAGYAQRDKERTDAILAETSATLDFAREQAIKGWYDSQKEKNGAKADPRYLGEIRQTAVDKAKLFGVIAPIKTDITSGGEPLSKKPKMTDEERMKRLKELAKAIAEELKKHGGS